MSCKVGSFNITTNVATTAVAVTGVGFTPTVVMFWWSGRTSGTDGAGGANAFMGFGVARTTTSRWALCSAVEDAVATTNCGRTQQSDACIALADIGGTVTAGLADLQSFDADGFTLVIDEQFGTDLRVSYLALGSPHTSIALGSFDSPGTGSLSEAGLGFTPACVIFAGINFSTEADTVSTTGALSFGVATGATHEWCVSTGSNDGGASSGAHAARYGFGDECASCAGGVAPAVNQRVEFTSLDADGFTINVLESLGISTFWIALAGGQYFAGDFVSRADTTQTGVTGVGFTPTGLLLGSVMAAEHTQDASTANAAMCIGAANSATSRTAQGFTEDDAEAATEVWTAIEHDEMYLRGGFADDLVGLMDLVSLDADGFTFVMDDADPDAAFIGFLAFGDNPATTGTGSGINRGLVNAGLINNGLVQ